MVEEEKHEHVEKVKELLGWVSTLARNTQSKAASSQTKELTDIEKAILEQQVSRKSALFFLDTTVYGDALGGIIQVSSGPPRRDCYLNKC